MFFLIQTKQTGIEVGGALVSFEGGEGGEEEIRAGHCVRNRFRVGGKGRVRLAKSVMMAKKKITQH
jgi:hypothetical protein